MEDIKLHFNSISGPDQWKWIYDNRSMIKEVILDTDNTSVHLKGDDDSNFVLYPKKDCGNRNGVLWLLRAIGLPANHC